MFQKLKNIYHLLTSYTFQAVYGFPAKKLRIIGITGTDGKTTTSSMVYHILKNSGRKASVITSVAANIGGKEYDTGFHVTTPNPESIPKFMSESVKNGDEFFVFEITSHGLDQNRAAGVRFEVAGITNITHEHLGYHKSFEEYVAAKAKLAASSKITFVNGDQDGLKELILKNSPKSNLKTYGLKNKSDIILDVTEKTGVYLEEFNKYNALLAYAICHQLGIPDDRIFEALKTFKYPPGRMEEVYSGDFIVISDFAHTPNALSKALPSALEKYKGIKRLIHVFGAAAFRDDSKRADMGRASGTSSNITILTEEDYRTEDPNRIFAMLEEGLEEKGFKEVYKDADVSTIQNKSYLKIINREEAIRKAVEIAQSGDLIIVTGKAQEKSLCRGTVEYPYNEKETIMSAVKNKIGKV